MFVMRRRREDSKLGGSLGIQMRMPRCFPVSRTFGLRIGNSVGADRHGEWSEYSRSSHSGNKWSEHVCGERALQAGPRSSAAFIAGGDRSRIEAEPRTVAVERGHPLGSGTTVGAVECTLAARGGGA